MSLKLHVHYPNSLCAGEWVCQVSALQPSLVSHSLQIRVHPVLLTKPDTALTVAEGEQAVLECSLAAGRCVPIVYALNCTDV